LSRFYRKIGSWLGLLAILMATLAPTISQTLAARSHEGAISSEHCSAQSVDPMDSMSQMGSMSSMSLPISHVSAAPDDPTGQHAQHTQMSNGDACGYCSLLAHLPVMPAVETLFFVAVRARQHVVATRFESVRRVEPVSFAQPRAPPFIA
jgi:hypothetical protein